MEDGKDGEGMRGIATDDRRFFPALRKRLKALEAEVAQLSTAE